MISTYRFQVAAFSKNYRKLISAEFMEFDECARCKKFITTIPCLCSTLEPAVRIQGLWTVQSKRVIDKFLKINFKQGNELFTHVVFDQTMADQFEEDQIYSLVGWQKLQSRHNILYVD